MEPQSQSSKSKLGKRVKDPMTPTCSAINTIVIISRKHRAKGSCLPHSSPLRNGCLQSGEAQHSADAGFHGNFRNLNSPICHGGQSASGALRMTFSGCWETYSLPYTKYASGSFPTRSVSETYKLKEQFISEEKETELGVKVADGALPSGAGLSQSGPRGQT